MKNMITNSCIGIACLGPLVGWFAHNAMILHSDSNVLGFAAFVSWAAVWIVASIAIDES